MGQPQVAVGPAHAHPVLQVPGQGQVLVVVPDGLLVVAQTVVSVAQEMTGLRLALDIIEFLTEHQIVLVERHGLTELSPGAVAVTEVTQSAGLPNAVLQLPGDVEVAVVVDQRHLPHLQGLVGHGQVPVGAGLAAPVVALLGDGELLLVVLDGLLVVAHGAVGVPDVPEGAAHAGPVVELPADVEVRLVELQGGVVVPQELIDDTEVGASPTLCYFVFCLQGIVQLLIVIAFSRQSVPAAASRVTQAGVSSGLQGLIVVSFCNFQNFLVEKHGFVIVPLVVVGTAQVAVGPGFLHVRLGRSGNLEVFLMTLYGILKVAHCQIDSPHIANLSSLGQDLAGLLQQKNTLLVAG